MAMYLIFYSKNIIKLEEIPFEISADSIKDLKNSIDVLDLHTKKNEEPAIILEGDYQYFMYPQSKMILTKWGGDYPGEKIYSFETEESMYEWLMDHVAKKIIGSIKIKTKEGHLRKILVDRIGILYKIFKNDKLKDMILSKTKAIDLPEKAEEIYNYLKDEMQIDNNHQI